MVKSDITADGTKGKVDADEKAAVERARGKEALSPLIIARRIPFERRQVVKSNFTLLVLGCLPVKCKLGIN